ncbi:MAG: DUF1150 family protein [Rickettsiales bacterium]
MQVETVTLEELMMSMVGVETMAYIKPVSDGNEAGFAVFAADGTQLAIFPTEEGAYYTARQNNLDPVSIH